MGWGISCLVGCVVHPVEAPRVTLGWFPPCFVGCKKYPRVYYTHIPSRPRKGAGFATPEDPTKTGKSRLGYTDFRIGRGHTRGSLIGVSALSVLAR